MTQAVNYVEFQSMVESMFRSNNKSRTMSDETDEEVNLSSLDDKK
jgi:hypothetical protein